jgi:asparagine synthase (glutamine-hydrolysing)
VARHFGTEHTELEAAPATCSLLPELARQFDEPIADSSMVPTYLVSRLIREHAHVALGGDGGDELFGGYPHYNWLIQQERTRRFLPRRLRAAAGALAASAPVGLSGRHHLIGFSDGIERSVAHVNMYFDARSRARLLAPMTGGRLLTPAPELHKAGLCQGSSPLQMATSVDFQSYLPDDLLVKVDRASMLTSLEVRAPWLDHRLVEFAFGRVPDRLRATGRERKVLTRRLARRLLPSGLNLERKQGFSLPLASWFRGAWGAFMEGVLAEADPGLFDPGFLRALVEGQRRGRGNTQRLFALTLFELWRREYRVSA